jgi:hypothetical protein
VACVCAGEALFNGDMDAIRLNVRQTIIDGWVSDPVDVIMHAIINGMLKEFRSTSQVNNTLC